MCWPSPLRWRSVNAARIAVAAYMPVRMSVIATPTFIGSLSGSTRRSQPADHLLTLGLGELDRDRSLAPVRRQEVGALAGRAALVVGEPRWPPAARIVAD